MIRTTRLLYRNLTWNPRQQHFANLVVKIYPNPGNGIFWLELETEEKEIPDDLKVTISNLDGELMHQLKVIGLKTEIDLSALPDGGYLITLSSGDHSMTRKVIKT